MNVLQLTASAIALPNSFPPGAFPEYRLDCTQLSNATWHCSPVEQQCVSFVELGVVCRTMKIYTVNVLGLVHCLHCQPAYKLDKCASLYIFGSVQNNIPPPMTVHKPSGRSRKSGR